MTPVLETSRLVLRPLVLSDAEAAQKLFPHWEIVRFLNARVPWPYPDDGALQFYRDVALPAVERGEQWIWAILLKGGPDHLIGSINLSVAPDDNRGFWLGSPWQGQGLMQEACEAVTDFWFNELGRETLRVSKAAQNLASRRVSEKQGARLTRIEERDFASGRLPAGIWELTREEWNARRRRD
ncbi:MAG: GNAT family N-acetyltransferase [Rhodomicrobium sp.]|nr:GNAT family N-acetyltransferase [Rhodomicrobium sp.]